MTIGVPVQSPAAEVEDPVECFARRGVGVEHQRAGEICRRICRAENQVPVASQDAHVVRVLVERMLPSPWPIVRMSVSSPGCMWGFPLYGWCGYSLA